jgi:hypothetical protein
MTSDQIESGSSRDEILNQIPGALWSLNTSFFDDLYLSLREFFL